MLNLVRYLLAALVDALWRTLMIIIEDVYRARPPSPPAQPTV